MRRPSRNAVTRANRRRPYQGGAFWSKRVKAAYRAIHRAHMQESEPSYSPTGKVVRPAYVATKPDRTAYTMASISDNFWARVKPKPVAAPQGKGMGAGPDDLSRSKQMVNTSPLQGVNNSRSGEPRKDTVASVAAPSLPTGGLSMCPTGLSLPGTDSGMMVPTTGENARTRTETA